MGSFFVEQKTLEIWLVAAPNWDNTWRKLVHNSAAAVTSHWVWWLNRSKAFVGLRVGPRGSSTCWRCFPACDPTDGSSPTAAARPSGSAPPVLTGPRHRTPRSPPAPSGCWRYTLATGRSGWTGSRLATPARWRWWQSKRRTGNSTHQTNHKWSIQSACSGPKVLTFPKQFTFNA